ncbi:MAG TPA: hypothetical protein VG318_03970 [Actinomycetota bacterium]|nr:hypothetical protein [Actinomycetota bacterium]
MIRRTTTAILAAILTAGLLIAPASTAAHACGAAQRFEMYEVSTRWEKKVYRPGETVRVEVTVMTPTGKDPLGLGVEYEPPAQEPVADAEVFVAFSVGVPPVFGLGTTNADGVLTLEIPLKTKVRGLLQSTTQASSTYGRDDVACSEIVFFGRLFEQPIEIKKKG